MITSPDGTKAAEAGAAYVASLKRCEFERKPVHRCACGCDIFHLHRGTICCLECNARQRAIDEEQA